MSISYSKEMKKIAADQGTSLMTVDIPGLKIQTPSADEETVNDLDELVNFWLTSGRTSKNNPEYPTLRSVWLVVKERLRQFQKEGWTAEHDDSHSTGGLAQAAACYAMSPQIMIKRERYWPWEKRFWKPTPKDRIRELTKAAALILAEIDRLQRIEETKKA